MRNYFVVFIFPKPHSIWQKVARTCITILVNLFKMYDSKVTRLIQRSLLQISNISIAVFQMITVFLLYRPGFDFSFQLQQNILFQRELFSLYHASLLHSFRHATDCPSQPIQIMPICMFLTTYCLLLSSTFAHSNLELEFQQTMP